MLNPQIERFIRNGYSCFHLFGKWYLVRHYSKSWAKFSWYDLHKVKN